MLIDEPPPLPEGYTAMQRYSDFRHVFLGNAEGKRVLRQILEWCQVYRTVPAVAPMDPCVLAHHNGERNVARQIWAAIEIEPKERPTQAKRAR